MSGVVRDVATAAWEATCDSVRWAIGAAIEGPGLARQKGKTAAEVKRDFFIELARESYSAGYERGRKDAAGEGKQKKCCVITRFNLAQ